MGRRPGGGDHHRQPEADNAAWLRRYGTLLEAHVPVQYGADAIPDALTTRDRDRAVVGSTGSATGSGRPSSPGGAAAERVT